MIATVRYWALPLAGLAVAASTAARSDTGSLAGVVQVTLSLDRAEFLPQKDVTCTICYENVSQHTVTMQRPGPANSDYWYGEYYRLFDHYRQELAPNEGMISIMHSPEDFDDLVLAPGEEYCVLGDPVIVGHEAQYEIGDYSMQVRFHYYDEVRPEITDVPDIRGAILAWRQAHYKYLESNLVFFARVQQLGRRRTPRVSVDSMEVAEARPLLVDNVIYAHAGALSAAAVTAEAKEGQVIVRRGDRRLSLALGKRDADRGWSRPAIAGVAGLYLPLRQVATALGLRVNWDPATQTVDVRT